MVISPGTRLGRYEIRAPLGAGGMGKVYLAHYAKLDRKVALKSLPDVASNQERMPRFVQEAKAASALIDGETLRQRIRHAQVKKIRQMN